MLFCSLGASEHRWESLELKFKKRRLNTSIFYALCLCHSLNYQNFLKPFLVEFFCGVGKVDASEGCMRGTSLDVKPLAISSAKLAWRRVMPCMRQIITWLLAEVFNSLSSYRVVWLKARVSQNSETASFALIKVWFIFQLVMSLSFYNNMFCNERKDTRTVSFCDTSASISQFFQTTAIICYYIRQWKNLKKIEAMKCFFVVEVKYYISGSFLGSMHTVHVCGDIQELLSHC